VRTCEKVCAYAGESWLLLPFSPVLRQSALKMRSSFSFLKWEMISSEFGGYRRLWWNFQNC